MFFNYFLGFVNFLNKNFIIWYIYKLNKFTQRKINYLLTSFLNNFNHKSTLFDIKRQFQIAIESEYNKKDNAKGKKKIKN